MRNLSVCRNEGCFSSCGSSCSIKTWTPLVLKRGEEDKTKWSPFRSVTLRCSHVFLEFQKDLQEEKTLQETRFSSTWNKMMLNHSLSIHLSIHPGEEAHFDRLFLGLRSLDHDPELKNPNCTQGKLGVLLFLHNNRSVQQIPIHLLILHLNLFFLMGNTPRYLNSSTRNRRLHQPREEKLLFSG